MNLEFIQDLWDKDSIIDNELLHNESTKIPALHAKYYKIYNNILTLKKAQEKKKSGNIIQVRHHQRYMLINRLTSKS
jgi:hypothetical protein